MDIATAITNILTGGVAGGITGIIGSISSAIVNYKMKKLEYEHQEKLKQLELESKRIDIELSKAKISGQLELAEQETLKESYKELLKSYFTPFYYESLPDWMKVIIAFLFALLDFIRGITRPLLTFLLLLLAFWIGYNTYQADPNSFTTSATVFVTAIVYLTTTAVAWWYSDRKIEKFLLSQFKPSSMK